MLQLDFWFLPNLCIPPPRHCPLKLNRMAIQWDGPTLYTESQNAQSSRICGGRRRRRKGDSFDDKFPAPTGYPVSSLTVWHGNLPKDTKKAILPDLSTKWTFYLAYCMCLRPSTSSFPSILSYQAYVQSLARFHTVLTCNLP